MDVSETNRNAESATSSSNGTQSNEPMETESINENAEESTNKSVNLNNEEVQISSSQKNDEEMEIIEVTEDEDEPEVTPKEQKENGEINSSNNNHSEILTSDTTGTDESLFHKKSKSDDQMNAAVSSNSDLTKKTQAINGDDKKCDDVKTDEFKQGKNCSNESKSKKKIIQEVVDLDDQEDEIHTSNSSNALISNSDNLEESNSSKIVSCKSSVPSTEKVLLESETKSKVNAGESIKCNGMSEDKNKRSLENQDSNAQNKILKVNYENERREKAALLDNQVQCVNLHCTSGYDLAEAPVFVLTYFGVLRRRNVLQKVCKECFNIALKHQETLANMLKNHLPLMKADFPRQKDDVVVMDSVDEIYEEDPLPLNVISEIEAHLMDVMTEVVQKYDIDYQIEEAQNVLSQKYDCLEVFNKSINDELNAIENQLKETRYQMYKDFTPKIRNLPALNIIEPGGRIDPMRSLMIQQQQQQQQQSLQPKPRVATKKVTQMSQVPKCVLPPTYVPPADAPSHEVVAIEEVEVPQTKLPPIGNLVYPPLSVGEIVYVMKMSYFGVWVRGKIIEICPRNVDGISTYKVRYESSYRSNCTKLVTGKQIAYSKPSAVRYPVGTRVIAIFQNTDSPGKEVYYVGLIAEPPKHLNKFRYLVFFDDGYAQYVPHEKILLVCEASRLVYEDVHPDSRDFIKQYLDQYPERPMVKLQQGQVVRTEWNGKWWVARALEIDCSLAKMHFDADKRTEWIYRGSARLGPLFAEMTAAAARKEQGAMSRHRSLGIASLKKRNMPYVEYSVEQDESKAAPTANPVSKNVARKSTARPSNADSSGDKSSGPPKPFEKMEYPTKGVIRVMDLPNRITGKPFVPHQCGPACIEWTEYNKADCKGVNPLALPLFFGFERQVVKTKGKRSIMYRAPCGRRLRNMIEMHRYLRITKSNMGLDLFDYDYWVRALDEFYLEPASVCTYLKDISYGRENTPVPCINEINHSWPLFMDYSTSRLPQDGVNINLDENFLVCCDCTDDCQDKEKCECWQLTIEGTKLGPGGEADPTVGYQFKRLPEPVTTGIYECNQRCKCSSTCLNRVAQHPLQLNLQVFRTLKKGWGLRAVNDIPRGSFICIYAGRLHTEQSANDGGRMYGDEYLAELDYIEVVERFKEGYESEVIEPEEGKNGEEDEDDDNDHEVDLGLSRDYEDKDYVPEGLNRIPHTEKVFTTRSRRKKIENSEEKSESETEKEKEEETTTGNDDGSMNGEDDDDEMKKKPSKFLPDVPVEDKPRKYKSVREYFGDGADDCYIMDAKSSGNIGRYLNHSCQPNVFVQNVFVDTHDVRFPWVAFFALTYIKAGTELTWDYNYDIGSVPGKVLYCYCNNADCRGRLL